MDLRSESSSPYVFNTLKHHVAFIRGFVQKARYYDTERIQKELRIIGNSVIDLYIGDLSPIRITDEIGDLLKGRNCFDQKLYTAFLENRPKKFETVVLSDGSAWVLLLGIGIDSYIHIHPARGSKHTMRIKALALKTAILIRIFYLNDEQDIVDLANKVRQEILKESPIKIERDVGGLERILQVIL